mmetsp:Transcript_19612/g.60668  ORF Transcript_19612/g.60668 Transcript_19612/m.60668 type:complete len:522 (-) Transcript_19612:709-2274(-)
MAMKTNGNKTHSRGAVGWRRQTFLGVCVGAVVVLGATRLAQKASHGSMLKGSASTTVVKDVPPEEPQQQQQPQQQPQQQQRQHEQQHEQQQREPKKELRTTKYLTIIDAGSSGCRAHVFTYVQSGTAVEVNPQHESFKVRPGLSSYADSPEKAGASVEPLLDFIASQIPEAQRNDSPIFLKATAGLRLVEASKRDAILKTVSDVFSESEFAFDAASGAAVIPGTEEGGFGWMSVNFLMHTTDGDSVSVVEMGGASAQVTMLYAKEEKKSQLRGGADPAVNVPKDSLFDFDADGEHFDLYAHSYLGYGLEKAREAVTQYLQHNNFATDPCVNAGYEPDANAPVVYDGTLPGGGDARTCAEVVDKALFPEEDGDAVGVEEPDANKLCPFDNCSNIQRAFQPKTLPQTRLLVFENFYYTFKMLGGGFDTPDGYEQRAPDVCDRDFDDLKASDFPKDGSDKADLNKLCFAAVYLPAFLKKGLKLPADEHLTIQQEVGDFDIDWSLGAAIREANKLASSSSSAAVL